MKSLLCLICCSLFVFFVSTHSAMAQSPLIIWMSTQQSVSGVKTIAKRFERASGIKVIVQTPLFMDAKFPLFAPNGNGPDIILTYHHQIGLWASHGLLANTEFSASSFAKYIPLAINSLKYRNQYYGYPLGIEVLSLAYNKNLVSNPPSSWYEMQYWQKILSRQGKKSLVWDYHDTELSFPFLSAYGAYSFAHSGFTFNGNHSGLTAANASRGIDFIRALLAQQWLPNEVNQEQIEREFRQQQQAMMLVKPQQWQSLKQLGFQVGLSAIPLINGESPKPFINVYSALINQYSTQKDIADYFITNYLTTEQGLASLDKHVSLGVPAYIPYLNQVASNPWIQVSFTSLKYGQLTPNIPEISRFFKVMEGVWPQLSSHRPSADILLDAERKLLPAKAEQP
ncbi:maltose/maltodextrin ABC transporter substrate-binding protein MalE [Motilimonas cestriensis]|uniref:maltose/maltodextrin ABC transporter substrate-binding protein MalE n=1 Tax=Motilimonas cestriensis TaxID=2742685 RepID=UPI003DA5E95A